MEISEKYEFRFVFVGRRRPTIEHFKDAWSVETKREFNHSGIYVNAVIDERFLTCVDCLENERAYIVTAIRNPAQVPSEEDYYIAIGNILNEVRQVFNSPYIIVICEKVHLSFFPNSE